MPTLLDHLGRPIRTSRLRKQQGGATLTGARKPFYETIASGLTPDRLSTILKEAARGRAQEYLSLAVEMESRDSRYLAALTQRKSLITELPVTVAPASDDARDVAIADEVRAIVEDTDFAMLLFDLLDGLGKGFSLVQTIWDSSERQWWPERFEHADPRHFQTDSLGRTFRLREHGVPEGVELTPWQWIEHRPRLMSAHPLVAGLARPVSVLHLFKGMALRDWLIYAEVFGMPVRIGRYTQGALEDDIETLRDAVRGIGVDASAVLPDGMDIEFQGAMGGGNADLYEKLARWCDEQTAQAVLSQTMTTQDGSSRSQAEVMERMLRTITRRDVLMLKRTIARDLVKPYVDLNHGQQQSYPVVGILVEDPEDPNLWHKAAQEWAKLGLPVVERAVNERLSLPEAEEEDTVLRVRGGGESGGGGPDGGPRGEGEGEEESAGGSEQNTALARSAARLMVRVEAGETLTVDQWRLVDMHAAQRGDAIDDLVDGTLGNGGWREVAKPIVDPVVQLASRAESYEDFRVKLAELSRLIDVTPAQQDLALQAFRARGMGDATDKV